MVFMFFVLKVVFSGKKKPPVSETSGGFGDCVIRLTRHQQGLNIPDGERCARARRRAAAARAAAIALINAMAT
jgi:hypothetical protein